jgi:hypothetical protein
VVLRWRCAIRDLFRDEADTIQVEHRRISICGAHLDFVCAGGGNRQQSGFVFGEFVPIAGGYFIGGDRSDGRGVGVEDLDGDFSAADGGIFCEDGERAGFGDGDFPAEIFVGFNPVSWGLKRDTTKRKGL